MKHFKEGQIMERLHLDRSQREYIDAMEPGADLWTPDGYHFIAVLAEQSAAYAELRSEPTVPPTTWIDMSEGERESIRPRRVRLVSRSPQPVANRVESDAA